MKEILGQFELKISEDDNDVAYLRLPTYPVGGHCKMSKAVRLRDLLNGYEGPDVNLDFDETGTLVGVEVLV